MSKMFFLKALYPRPEGEQLQVCDLSYGALRLARVKDTEHSYIELFRDDTKIESSMYDDFDRQFSTFENKHFMMRCDSIHKAAFIAEIGYHRGDCSDYYFDTAHFDIDVVE